MKSQSRKQSIVWGGLLILFGVVGLVEVYTDLSAWGWVAVLGVAGLGVFGVYLTDRSEWGLLIPAYVMWVVAGLVALITLNVLRDPFIPTYVLAAIMLPFLVAYLRDREQWWALIPAYVLLAVGMMVGLIGQGVLGDLLIPAYVMFAVAIPFFVVYARDSRQWWALIPGGIMTVIGLSFLVAQGMFQYVGAVALLLAGAWTLGRQFARREPAAPGPGADEPSVE
jgi:TM2 domain-containing membrane protein YozV